MKTSTSRRDFARHLAAAGVATLVPSSINPQTAAGPAPAPHAGTEEFSTQLAAMLQLLQSRFPDRFNAEQLKQARSDFEAMLRNSDRMSKAGLKNSDEPDFVFSAGHPRAAGRKS